MKLPTMTRTMNAASTPPAEDFRPVAVRPADGLPKRYIAPI